MKLRDDVNDFGTPVRWYHCDDCQQEYSVCPVPADDEDWQSCGASECATYDPTRNVDKLFDEGPGGSGRVVFSESVHRKEVPESA